MRYAMPSRHLKVRLGKHELVLQCRHRLDLDVPRRRARQPQPRLRVSSSGDGLGPCGAALGVVDGESALLVWTRVLGQAGNCAEGARPVGFRVVLVAEDLGEFVGELYRR